MSDWFTRTVPVNTAAYTRIKEYYDFYAVPLRLISRALPQAFTQMTDYMTSAASSTTNTSALTTVPNVTQSTLNLFLQTANSGDQTNTRDDAGLPIVYGSCKLLDMLGYGSMIASTNTGKAAITKKYLGVDALGDADNPWSMLLRKQLTLFHSLLIRRFIMTFSVTVNGKNIKPMPIM